MMYLRNIALLTFLLLVLGVKAQTPNWSINPADYQYTMTVTSVGLFNCEQTTDANDMVAAFIDGNLAGYSAFDIVVGGSNYAFMTVFSNVALGQTIEYRMYDASSNSIQVAKYGSIFQENASIGNTVVPFEMQTDYKLIALNISTDTLFDYSVTGDEIAEFSLVNENMEGLTAAYSFVFDADGADNTYFSIQGNVLVLEEDVDYYAKDQYKIHILATSSTGCTLDRSWVMQVFNTNVPPTDIIENPAYINENEPIGSFAALMQAVDLTPVDYHTYELIGDPSAWPDNAAFTINYDEILSAVVFDYETQSEYTLQILVTDKTGNTYVDTFTILVNDLIEGGDLKAPNYISPNGDGINDYFAIENVELYNNYSLFFYNDNGNEVFSVESNYDNTWSGISNNGQELPSASYFYYFVDRDDSTQSYKGKLIIERPTKY